MSLNLARFLPAGAGLRIGIILLFSDNEFFLAFRAKTDILANIVEVNDLRFDVICDLQGHSEDTMASEATNCSMEQTYFLTPFRLRLLVADSKPIDL